MNCSRSLRSTMMPLTLAALVLAGTGFAQEMPIATGAGPDLNSAPATGTESQTTTAASEEPRSLTPPPAPTPRPESSTPNQDATGATTATDAAEPELTEAQKVELKKAFENSPQARQLRGEKVSFWELHGLPDPSAPRMSALSDAEKAEADRRTDQHVEAAYCRVYKRVGVEVDNGVITLGGEIAKDIKKPFVYEGAGPYAPAVDYGIDKGIDKALDTIRPQQDNSEKALAQDAEDRKLLKFYADRVKKLEAKAWRQQAYGEYETR